MAVTANMPGSPQPKEPGFDRRKYALGIVPAQEFKPRPPARIIVLCDGTAQQRNWVKSSLEANIDGKDKTLFKRISDRLVPSWKKDRNKKPSVLAEDSSATGPTAFESDVADSGDFFTNVALLAKVLRRGGSSISSPDASSTNASQGTTTAKSESPQVGAQSTDKSTTSERIMDQIVFYQSGVGTTTGFLQNVYDRGTGASLASKVAEAYGFISDNYQPGDELFLFGFSRGAYTARCISGLIHWCGVLDKVQMTHFADIWAAYQARDPDQISTERRAANILYEVTHKYPSEDSEKMATKAYLHSLCQNKNIKNHFDDYRRLEELRRTECNNRVPKVQPPQIKVVGVWDTVAAIGYPGFFQNSASFKFFDFYDPGLGPNIQFAFHALSLEEDRKDFLPTLWYQPRHTKEAAAAPTDTETPAQERDQPNMQVLKQCWFQGVHTDCGGGYQYHGLSDITLIWMVSQLVDEQVLPDKKRKTTRPLLDINLKLLYTILDRRREWAKQLPHRSRLTPNFQATRKVHPCGRKFFTHRSMWADLAENGRTHESIHPSVPRGGRITPDHPVFDWVRESKPAWLEKAWADAEEDLETSLGPTEKLLYWDKRGAYPWRPPPGDPSTNPTTLPDEDGGAFFFPEFASLKERIAIFDAANKADLGDVDDGREGDYDSTGGRRDHLGDGNGDVNDQATDGWGSLVGPSSPTSDLYKSSKTTFGIPMPDPTWPIIPSHELGENPVDPRAHPWLHSLWPKVYWAASLPYRGIVDVLNRRLVNPANLHQTGLQSFLWKLGDKLGGYSEQDKLRALTAGVARKPKSGRKVFKKVPYTVPKGDVEAAPEADL